MINKSDLPSRSSNDHFNEAQPVYSYGLEHDHSVHGEADFTPTNNKSASPNDPSGSNRPFSVESSPPAYDDPNYIPSPSTVTRNQSMPLLLRQPTSSTTTWSTLSGMPDAMTATDTSTVSPDVEQEWNEAFHKLERDMAKLQSVRSKSAMPKQINAEESAREVRMLEKIVLGNMRRLAQIHPDPLVQDEWATRADVFARTMASPSETALGKYNAMGPTSVMDDDFVFDKNRGEGSSGSMSMGQFGRKMFASPGKEKGTNIIAKGTAGIFLAPVIISGVLIYGSLALAYHGGKAAVNAGKKAMNSSGSGTPAGSRRRRRRSF